MHRIKLTKPQTEFTHSRCKYPLFLAGFGSGKSICLGVNVLNDLTYPGADVGVYAPTFDLLSLITIPYFEEMLSEANIPYNLNKQSKILHIEGMGKIIMRSLDNPARIVGYQTFRAHIDELDTLPAAKAAQAWNKIIARNRQKIFVLDEKGHKIQIGWANDEPRYMTYLNRVSSYTTPEGFNFCYERWEKVKKAGYEIFRASTYSNAHNLPDDYISTLKDTYPAELIDAYINGIFVNLKGGRVYPQFNRDTHDSQETVIKGEEIYVGMDFNVLKGAAVIHVLRENHKGETTVHAVDEIHNAFDTDEQIKYLTENYSDNIVRVYPDASGSHRSSSNTTATDIFKLEEAGFDVYVDHSNPLIKDRVYSFQAMLKNGHGKIRYKVNIDRCPELTMALEQQIWGPNGLPDKTAGVDHILDGPGYFIFKEFPIMKPMSVYTNLRGGY